MARRRGSSRQIGSSKRHYLSNPVPADILLTLGDLGIDVEKVSGDEAWALCPGHEAVTGSPDRRASWSINLNTGMHSCFSCGWGGPYVRLVSWMWDWDEEKSADWIRKHGGFESAKKRFRGEAGWKRKEAEKVTDADMALFTDPPQWALEERDIDLESCQAFGVRYIPSTKRWVFPIREPYTNTLMGWQEKGRVSFNNHPEHVMKSVTLFGFNLLEGLDTSAGTAYLEESPLDAVRLHTYGVDGAVSSYGVHVSSEQMSLLCDAVRTLYVCLDNDKAGRVKERKIWEEYRHRTHLMFVNYSQTDKKDHGEMTPEEISWSLENAYSALRFRP